MRPAAHLLFLLAQEKKAKEVRPTGRDPSLRYGQPAMLAGEALPQNSLRCCAASCRQLRPVRARSVGMLRCPRAPHPLRFSARPEGVEAQLGPSLRSAWVAWRKPRHVTSWARVRYSGSTRPATNRGPSAAMARAVSRPLLDAPGAGCWRGGACTAGCTRFVI